MFKFGIYMAYACNGPAGAYWKVLLDAPEEGNVFVITLLVDYDGSPLAIDPTFEEA